MNIRGSSPGAVITAKTTINSITTRTTGNNIINNYEIIKDPAENNTGTNVAFFDIIPFSDTQENNILLTLPNRTTNSYKGRYLYDIELEYKIGTVFTPSTGEPSVSVSSFVIRLLQGRITFNPNITITT
jgi:hypothetical protein